MPLPSNEWWKTSTCYQIWPLSYKDSDGDGRGDISGITSTLDYLKGLGIDTIWLSPMYDSPQKDFGYDVSDYQKIYPPFGTIDDMESLIKSCHDRQMKIVLDLVINHTSEEHAWFHESKSSQTNPKTDWYIWRDGRIIDGRRHPPNNWRSVFGGSAWEYVAERDQYYLHVHMKEQPDLNWENPETRNAIHTEILEFWLQKGIDGFRIDAMNIFSKDTTFPDAPVTLEGEEFQHAIEYFTNRPLTHEWLKEIKREVIVKYGDIFVIGECPYADTDAVLSYIKTSADEVSCVFDADTMLLGYRYQNGKKHHFFKHNLPDFKVAMGKVQYLIRDHDCWGTVFLENHDGGRSLTRFATDGPKWREKAAKLLAIFQATLTGTLFLYQGQEIGMYNYPEHWTVDDLKDPDSINAYNEIKNRYDGNPLWLAKISKALQVIARDNTRIPVQWSGEKNAGFTAPEATPWMRIHDDYPNVNVQDQLERQNSPLSFWREALKIRKAYSHLTIFGDYEVHDVWDKETYTFVKQVSAGDVAGKTEELLVCMNFSSDPQPVDVPERLKSKNRELLIHNAESLEEWTLGPWEARVYLVK